MVEFKELPEEEQQKYIELASSILDGQLYCDRSWDAWHYNTMSENDFYNSNEDEGFVYEKAEEIYNFLKTRIRNSILEEIIK